MTTSPSLADLQKQDQIDISIVIVSFNTREVLRESLESIAREQGTLSTEIFVVDNNSRDESVEMVEREFPHVTVIRSAVNLGFGAANNVALERARGRYLVLLNSDAFLCPESLRLSVEKMDADKSVGLAGGRLVGRDQSWQPSARMFPSILSDLKVMTGLAGKFPKSKFFGSFDRTWADPMEAAEVDWVPGAYSIIRREALEQVGFFDPAFFLYSEEVDLCLRIQRAGWKIMYWPEIVVIHIGGESSRQIKTLEMSSAGAQLIRWRMRSTLLYYRKHHGWQVWLAKWQELALYHLTAWKNAKSSDPARQEKARRCMNMTKLMHQAWADTEGGRVSPARPWKFD